MSSELAKKQLEQFMFRFDEADKDKSGSLSFCEVCNIIKAQGGNEEQAKVIFGFMDQDQSKSVSKQEFTQAMETLPRSSHEEFHLRTTFKRMDKDGNGTLDAKEIIDATKTDCGLTNMQIFEILNDLRTDEDEKINYEEFLKVFKVEETAGFLRQVFRQIDKDNSGFLTKKEIVQLITGEYELRLSAGTLTALLNALASDDDEKLSYEEFIAAWKKGNKK